jgi:hypothetical protein
MNERLRRAIEAAQQLSDMDQCAVASCIFRRIGEIKNLDKQEIEAMISQSPCETDDTSTESRPLTELEFVEKLYRDGVIFNIPTRKPLTEEEEARRTQLSQACAGGKPLSEIVIEGRGPY